MDQQMLKSQISNLSGQIRQETEQYFEALTRKKDLSVARNIRMRLNSLHKNLDSRIQLLSSPLQVKP